MKEKTEYESLSPTSIEIKGTMVQAEVKIEIK